VCAGDAELPVGCRLESIGIAYRGYMLHLRPGSAKLAIQVADSALGSG